jgi:hypothetical protein
MKLFNYIFGWISFVLGLLWLANVITKPILATLLHGASSAPLGWTRTISYALLDHSWYPGER